MILLDTHVLLWTQFAEKSLGKKTKQLIERKWHLSEVAVSSITFWEVGQLLERGKIALTVGPREWRKTLLNAGLTELPLTGEIAMRSNELLSLHGDPADRFIAATAIEHHAELITADERLLDWRHGLQRHDARV
jgi:PIN domain nuclease of toxin-antitoxin system